jgi:ElaB/YqjD/DUF883 family membrane-anchored ribosome-binding protein/vacuolar-type H+-ATPase subunit H
MKQYEAPLGSTSGGRSLDSDGDDRAPEEIRVEIAQTRTEMSGTIDAIQQRLAPDVLTAQAKDIARDATDQAKSAAQEILQDAVREVKDAAKEVTAHAVHEVKDAARDVTVGAKDAAWDATVGRAEEAVSSAGESAKGMSSLMIDTLKQNPIPAALAGLSLFWLYKHRAASSSTGNGPTSGQYGTLNASTRTPQAYPIRTGYATQQERDAMAANAGRATTWSNQGTGAPHDVGDSESGILSSAGQMASDAASSAGHMASNAASTAGHMASSAGETAKDTGSSIIDLITQNPVPAALVGIGLSWLYMNRSSGEPDYRAHSGSHYLYGPDTAAQAYRSGQQSGQTSGGVGSTISKATGQVSDLAGSAQEHVGEMAGTVQDYVSDIAGSAQEHVSDMTETVMDRTQRAPGQIQRLIQERPLTAAAVAASLGAAVGFWLPSTQVENNLLGQANQQVMSRAQSVASDTLEKVQDVAQEVKSTVTEEVREKGLTV